MRLDTLGALLPGVPFAELAWRAPGVLTLSRPELAARLAALRFALANRYAASRRFEPALAQLIEIVRQRRQFKDDSARKLMLSIFDLARAEADLVARYRRELSSALH